MRRILVVSLNPAVDAEWRVETIRWEEKNSIEGERFWPGGKGVNVVRWLNHLGAESRLLLPLGGLSGRQIRQQLQQLGLSIAAVPITQPTRVNVIITQADGRQMRFNPGGPQLSRNEWRLTLRRTQREMRMVRAVVFTGSLPHRAPADTYRHLVSKAAQLGLRCLLDCDGAALGAAVKGRPYLVKPNHAELALWDGREVRSAANLQAAAGRMSKETGGWVLVSWGGRGGLLLNHALRKAWIAKVPKVAVKNTVGAGDALLAAAAQRINLNDAPENWLRWGLAAGTAATQCVAGKLPSRRLVTSLAGQIQISECFRRK